MSKSRFFVIALAIVMGWVAFSACSSDVEESNSNRGESDYDELYYAQNATISCSDSAFTVADEGGEIHLAVSGGEVRIDVDCGTEWIVYNDNSDVFSTNAASNSLTVSAGQNLVKSERTGTIYLMTRWYRIIFATITVTQDAYGAPEISIDTKEWHVPAVGELATEIAVEANGDWTAESDAEWLTIEKTGTGIILTAAQNPETVERTAEVTLTCADGYNSVSRTVKVTQDALSYITLSEEELSFPQFEGTVSINVESNYDWECSNKGDWVAIEKKGNGESMTITYTTNDTGVNRDCIITITAGDGASNVAEAKVNITQLAYSLTVDTNEWHAPAVGELNKVIAVEAPADWTVETSVDWLAVEKNETGIIITAKENAETTERVGEIALTFINVINSPSVIIAVTQDGAAYITLGEEELVFYAYEYTSTVSIESNYDWDCTCSSDWLSVEKNTNGKSALITYLTNEDISDREAVLTIIAGDGAENIAEVKLKVTQKGYDSEKSLILGYNISSTDQTIKLPLASVTYALIDWGDGEFQTVFSDYPSHKYSTTGKFTVTVNGSVGHICSYASNTTISGASCLTSVTQWGDLGLTSMGQAFYSCTGLTSLPKGAGPFSNVTSFSQCFSYCSSLTALSDEFFQNCSAVSSFQYVFRACTKLVSAPSFMGCTAATTFYRAFYHCTSMTTVPENMFSDCKLVTTFEECFEGCSALVSAPSFEGCTAATTYFRTFYECSSLTTLLENMFSGCTAATNFCNTFYECVALTALPENMFSGCTAATNISGTFQECTALITVPENIFSSCASATTFNYCFYKCKKLEGESPYTEINVDGETIRVHLYERENYPEYFTAPTGGSCFYTCTGLTDYKSIPSSWR